MKRTKKIFLGIFISLSLLYLALISIAYFPQQTIPIKELAGKEDKFITVNNHIIHYTKQGKGKPLLLVHGFAGSTYTWRKLIPLLTDNYTVYALDLLGFGLSDKPADGNYDLQSHGTLIIHFMNALNIPSATLVGHSMGGTVVGYAAVTAPSKVNSLVLISAGFYARGIPPFIKYLFFPLQRIMARQFYTRNFRAQSLLRSYYNKSLVTDEVIDAYMLPTRTPNALDALTQMMRTVGSRMYDDLAVKISQPALIFWGENDMANPAEDAERLQREIKGSQLVFIKESGHYVQEEQPRELSLAIKAFVK